MDQSAAVMNEANAARQRGQWRLAETLYRQQIQAQPDDAAALFGLGLSILGRIQGKAKGNQPTLRDAAAALGRAAALIPGHPGYHLAHGQALEGVGDLAAAAQAFLKASKLVPGDTGCAQALVRALAALGRWDDAIKVGRARERTVDSPLDLSLCLAKALERHPDGPAWAEQAYAQAIARDPSVAAPWLARARWRLKRRDISAAFADALQAQTIRPKDAAGLTVLAAIWRAKGELAQAEDCCRQALINEPQFVDAQAQLATLLDERKDHTQAEALFRDILTRVPERADVAYNLAGCLMTQDRPAEAMGLYQQALDQRPDWLEGWNNLGVALLAVGHAAKAEQAFAKAAACSGSTGDLAEARYNLAWAQLIQGDFRNGWASYEARWQMPGFSSLQRPFPVPLWDGTARPSGGIYLHAEQGLGDCIQMLRLVALVRQKVAPVVLEVPSSLVRLAQSVAGADHVVAANYDRPGEMAVACACHAPLMSLPLLLGLELTDVPAPQSYFSVPEQASIPPAAQVWADGHRAALRVGVVWAGAPSNKIDRFRSLAWDHLTPLWGLPGIAWASLQRGPRAGEGDGTLFPLLDGVEDMADSACRIGLLDLVVGVDTGVMHLVGALGYEGWMMIPFAPDYRWLESGERTPWYPTLRLVRQAQRGDWGEVIVRLAADLQQRVTEKGRIRGDSGTRL